MIDNGNDVIPIEVKAEVNLQAKRLKAYKDKFSPKISARTFMADYKKEDWLVNLPLYALDTLQDVGSGRIYISHTGTIDYVIYKCRDTMYFKDIISA